MQWIVRMREREVWVFHGGMNIRLRKKYRLKGDIEIEIRRLERGGIQQIGAVYCIAAAAAAVFCSTAGDPIPS